MKKGKTVGTLHDSEKMFWFRFLGKERPKNTQCVSATALIEIDLPRKACCSLRTDKVSYGTDTVIYGSSGKKRLPGLCSELLAASNFGVLYRTATRTVLIHCTTIRTTFSELPQEFFWMLTLVADNCSCPCRQSHMIRKNGDCVCNLYLCLEYRVLE